MNVIKVKIKDLPKHRTPIFNYCRQLIKEGVSPDTKLECYREHDEPDVTVIVGKGAKLTVIENSREGPYFAPYVPFTQRQART